MVSVSRFYTENTDKDKCKSKKCFACAKQLVIIEPFGLFGGTDGIRTRDLHSDSVAF